MPTNDERRDVAARLREDGNLRTFAETVGFSWEDETDWRWHDVAVKYADLIEPEPERTCRMEIDWDYDGDCPSYYRDYVCSECKEDFIYYKGSRVSYCPNCGAKVVCE